MTATQHAAMAAAAAAAEHLAEIDAQIAEIDAVLAEPTIAQLVARLAAADRATFAGMAEGPDAGRWAHLAETTP